MCIVCVSTWSLFRGQKELGPRPYRSPWFNSKFPTKIPTPFICGVPPPGVQPGSQNPDPILDQKCHFSHWFSDLVVVTKRNITCLHKPEIVIIAEIKTATKRFLKIHFELHFLSYSFGIETTNTLIHKRGSSVNYTRFQTKMGNIYTYFQTKTAQNPYPFIPLRWHIPIWLI